MKVGTPVTVERDETKYPSRGTWPRFRGKKGFVTAVVRGGGPVEYGVTFSRNGDTDAYFKQYELTERK
ncbi:hypothetical protein PBI_MYXUS_52 [Mycobacterium phage Myxus]|uniref:Uncharacterized protein n=9 Tax=Fromanvirus TaxID=186764 RepID=A0A142K4W0_9CAUD|nr:hypothetical protein AVV05_gp057 [Mycobacterium phage Pioneer]YP_009301875.1 hypothetical protein BJD80_gp058 [Mycobacterium phage Catalina]YP_009636021.1 hypothetical protein FGG56_gp52 [Mycobacterium phage PackMan]AMO43920.1 hypothetical protein PBI_MYXUS_52 [Mycobacterium phage Myxus]AMS00852.1 hypothetical protein PBI_EIDSMOE_52 [Mycobacterium phage Eidsmoe]AOQ29008.1 hypothetical protein SEA_HORTUMSL17_52 [Mycobacterium phage HortumSL17]AOT26170.1 hypothetical protein SEA_QOBBIT_52 [M